uniref:Putative secreted protein n=1 Tax=Ixodes ricinus TaxID=34613 RepID=A0A6B0UB84_IXORI
MFCWTQLFFFSLQKAVGSDLKSKAVTVVDSKLCGRLHFERFTTSAVACMLIRIFCKAPNGTRQIRPSDISMLIMFPICHQRLKQQTFYCTV